MKHSVIAKFLITLLMASSCHACANQVDEERAFLVESILSTPFTAVLSRTKVVKLVSDPNEWDIYLINADVIEPISGKFQKKISYKIYVEFAEEVILNRKSVIISLCGSKGDYYWPGVGAKFSASAELLEVARQTAKNKSINPTEDHCD